MTPHKTHTIKINNIFMASVLNFLPKSQVFFLGLNEHVEFNSKKHVSAPSMSRGLNATTSKTDSNRINNRKRRIAP